MLKLTQVARIFGVSRQTVLNWVNKKLIKAVRVDRFYFVDEKEIQRIKEGK